MTEQFFKCQARHKRYPNQGCGRILPESAFQIISNGRGRRGPYRCHLCRDCKGKVLKDKRSNPEKKKAHLVWYQKHRKKLRLERAGMKSIPQFCEACGKEKKLDMDHDHETGQFRGWLCRQCNLAEGLLGTVSAAKGLLKYMKRIAQLDLLSPDIAVSWNKKVIRQ